MTIQTVVTVSNALITAILDGAPISARERQRLIERSGMEAGEIRDVNGRTPIAQLARLWADLIASTGDEHIGLTIGASISGDRFGLAAHTAANSDDLRQLFERFTKYAPLINAAMACTFDPRAGRLAVKFHWDVFELERHAVDLTFAGILKFARERIGAAFALREVRLRHAITSAERRYREHFGAPIMLGADQNELSFDPGALDVRIRDANPELGLILDRYASAEISAAPVLTDLPGRIAQLIRVELEQHRPVTLAGIAAALKRTPRQIQRRLAESSTTFSALYDEVRKALAPALLAEPAANVEQVGFQLGYSEPTAFIRAFKKWYGVTPGKYRRTKP